jgi:hypothetical protein
MVEELHIWATINKKQSVLKECLYQNLKGLCYLPTVQEVVDSSQYLCISGLCMFYFFYCFKFLSKNRRTFV